MDIERLIPPWIENDIRDDYIKNIVLEQLDFIGLDRQLIYFKFKVDGSVKKLDTIKHKDVFLINIDKNVWQLLANHAYRYDFLPKKYLLETWEKC